LRTVTLGELTTEQHEVRLVRTPDAAGNDVLLHDLLALLSLVRQCRPRTMFEFGTFTGLTTLHFAMNTHDGTHIYTLDIPPQGRGNLAAGATGGWDAGIPDSIVGQFFTGTAYAAKVSQLLNDSRTLDTFPYDGRMDFVFMDTCHDYEFARNDTDRALRMVSPGGVAAWHDHSAAFPGVRPVLEDIAVKREVYWVKETNVAFLRN
jgi:predicted O-methyltransferase YrrM